MQVIYDYIATATVFLLIFTFSTASLMNIVEAPMQHVEQQQLVSRAETVMGNLLGYIGDPKGWANNITLQPSQLKAVGLSKMPKSDVIYDLDMDALSRLIPIDTGASISQSLLNKLLNLGNNYSFALSLTPVLNITVTPGQFVKHQPLGPAPVGQDYACYFTVTVRTHELTPVANVNLTAYILVAFCDSQQNLYYQTNETKYNITRWDGAATFNYTGFMTDMVGQISHQYTLVGTLFIVVGDFYGMQTMTVYQASHVIANNGKPIPILEGIQIGKYIIFNDTGIQQIPWGHMHYIRYGNNGYDSAECVFNGVYVTEVVDSHIGNQCPWLVNHDGKHYRIMELTYLEPDMYWVAFVVKYQGTGNTYGLVYFPRIPASFQVGPAIPKGTQVVSIRRVVFIENMAFFADFYFWRTNY